MAEQELHLLSQALQLHMLVEVEVHHIQLLVQQAQVELVEVVEAQVTEMVEVEALQFLELLILAVVVEVVLITQIILELVGQA
jgi:hypothetical protein